MISRIMKFLRALWGTSGEPSIGVAIPLGTGYRKPMVENELILKRHTYTDNSTIGDLVDSDHIAQICYTLEDTIRRKKEPGITAIPAGRYEIQMREFKGTGKMYPYLMDVPFYSGIFIHGGNTPQDTEGCVLVGMRTGVDCLYDSQKALNNFVIPRITELLKLGRLCIRIQGGYMADEWQRRNPGIP